MTLYLMALVTLFACGKDTNGDDSDVSTDDTGTVDTTDSGTDGGTDAGTDNGADAGTDDTGNGGDDTGTGTDDTGDTAGDTGGDTGDTGPVYSICDDYPELPLEEDSTRGWSGAEDFTFDGEGYHVSVSSGNLLRRNQAGDEIIVRPGLGSAAGIHMMPDGEHIVFADVSNNTIVKINLSDGGLEILAGGLSYPNGIEVGLDGMVYVAETSGGRILQIDPDSGDVEVLADDQYAANGIAFGPDHETLYWNSFGNGGVHSVTRDGDGWTDVAFLGATPFSDDWWDNIIDPCDGVAEGDYCYDVDGGIGVCRFSTSGYYSGGDIGCRSLDDEAPCDGLEVGDTCSYEMFGETVENLCVEEMSGGGGPGGSPDLVCPVTPLAMTEPCEDAVPGGACEIDGVKGICSRNWERLPVCIDPAAEAQKPIDACTGKTELEGCVIEGNFQPATGVCMPDDKGVMTCSSETDGGDLDGLNVDECGNVYVTEYVDGRIWMFPPDTGEAELVAEIDSYWIPNLHWGNGVGGWDPNILYVADRGYGGGGARLFELDIVVGGAPEAFTPEIPDTTDTTEETDATK